MTTTIRHINCGTLQVPPNPKAICHCLLLEDENGLTLIDTGIGLQDVLNPLRRLGREIIGAAGFLFNESDTALRQIEKLGLRPADVKHIVLTHADPDHTGGLADFPLAQVHLSEEERAAALGGNPRYVPAHFAHGVRWQTHPRSADRWFGLDARPLGLGFASEVLLIPLFGHTLGHCGVAVRQGNRWTLHVGDAYYLKVETETDDHPVSRLTTMRADDNARRIASLGEIKRLIRDHGDEIDLFGYHDSAEFPGQIPS